MPFASPRRSSILDDFTPTTSDPLRSPCCLSSVVLRRIVNLHAMVDCCSCGPMRTCSHCAPATTTDDVVPAPAFDHEDDVPSVVCACDCSFHPCPPYWHNAPHNVRVKPAKQATPCGLT